MKKSIFGYNVKEVDKILADNVKEIERLNKLNSEQQSTIKSLEEKISKIEREEDLIKEAIVDAKSLSKRLLGVAKEQATEMLFDAERHIQEQFTQFDASMNTLNHLRNKVASQKEELTRELSETLERYKNALIEFDTGRFDSINREITEAIEKAEDNVKSTKQIIVLPTVKTETEPETSGELAKDIPVYTFQ